MIRFVRIKNPGSKPQASSIFWDEVQYTPVFWHTTIVQDRPIGSRRTFIEHKHDFYHIVLGETRDCHNPVRHGDCFSAKYKSWLCMNKQDWDSGAVEKVAHNHGLQFHCANK
jgi:hypothetical protein